MMHRVVAVLALVVALLPSAAAAEAPFALQPELELLLERGVETLVSRAVEPRLERFAASAWPQLEDVRGKTRMRCIERSAAEADCTVFLRDAAAPPMAAARPAFPARADLR